MMKKIYEHISEETEKEVEKEERKVQVKFTKSERTKKKDVI